MVEFRAIVLSALCVCALGQSLTSFDSAVASSTYSTKAFLAGDALSPGSSYWCSSGNHPPAQIVTFTGFLSAPQMATGVKLNWAYAPGEVKILVSADAGNFEDASAWRASGRAEVSYEEVILFDKARSVKALTVAMRSPMPWGYFGLNDIALLSQPGPVLLLSGSSSPGGELCLVSVGGGVAAEGCLEAIAAGAGKEVFSFNAKSQIESAVDGRCVVLANGGAGAGALTMGDCETAEEAQDGRSTFEVTAAGQLKLGANCVVLGPTGASVGDCDAAGASVVSTAAVQDFDARAASDVRDVAALLAAAASRQRGLLAQLRDAAQACSGAFASNVSSARRQTRSLAGAASGRSGAQAGGPATEAVAKIDSVFGVDLAATKALIAESAAALKSAGA